MADLGTHEGRPILGQKIKMRKTGDGLSTAVKVDPLPEPVAGKIVYVLYKAVITDVTHPPEKRHDPGFGGVWEVPDLDAMTATFVDESLVGELIEKQEERNIRYEAEQRSQSELRDTALIDEHEEGKHDEFVEHCPVCLMLRDHDGGKHDKRRKQGCPLCEARDEAGALADEEAKADDE